MKIIEAQAKWISGIDRNFIYQTIEKAGRVCYKSEDKITSDSSIRFVKNIIQRGHLSVIEHIGLTAHFVCSRGCSHELVRHRLSSYSQESTRYVNYKNKEIEFIRPEWADNFILEKLQFSQDNNFDKHPFTNSPEGIWFKMISQIETAYCELLETGLKPEAARGVLPNDLKTEIYVTTNLRNWLWIFYRRCDKAAHYEIRGLMNNLKNELEQACPELFINFGSDDYGKL